MDFKKLRKLRELRSKYKYDISVMKQERPDLVFNSEEEELEVLASVHLSKQITIHIQEYCDTVTLDTLVKLIQLGIVCNESIGKIAKMLEEKFPSEDVDKALAAIDHVRDSFRRGTESDHEQ